MATLGAAALALVGLVAGCRGAEPLAANVVLISIDTLRPDHLGCYGYERETSPHLDALCRRAVVFEQAISHAPSTLMSHASLLTSLTPPRHGASFARRRALAEEVVTLAEVLRERGFRTASFNEGGQLAGRWGLAQGFERYDSGGRGPDRFENVVADAFDWLDAPEGPGGAPFFLFLHSYQVHHPYTPDPADLARFAPPGYDGWLGDAVEIRELRWINHGGVEATPADRALIAAAYDAEILDADRALGHLLAGLRERRLLDRTLVVFTSDHGEEMGEHGTLGWHTHTLYDELLRVPLVVALPAGRWAGERVARQVRLIDVAPTVLAAVGIEPPQAWQGTSLLEILRGERVPPLLALSQRDTGEERPVVAALRTGRWKWYDGRLHDLLADPAELHDYSHLEPDLSRALEASIEELLRAGPLASGEAVELDRETAERLKALGYL
ncbi:MAG TPA: sulfatase [Thermoanaerobaculia bacterium]|nr:sulfatase [Thermoanaerobaculia bacterium]